jgi:hypothetical protein
MTDGRAGGGGRGLGSPLLVTTIIAIPSPLNGERARVRGGAVRFAHARFDPSNGHPMDYPGPETPAAGWARSTSS